MEGTRTSKVLWTIFYALLTGVSLALFTLIDGMIKFLFSIAGLYLGVKYFKRSETMGYKILYIILALVFFFLFIFGIVAFTFMKENYNI